MRLMALMCAISLIPATALSASASDRTGRVAQAAQSACEQVISCGTKNGVRKEYPTPCAARDDGATDIRPKIPSDSCGAATK